MFQFSFKSSASFIPVILWIKSTDYLLVRHFSLPEWGSDVESVGRVEFGIFMGGLKKSHFWLLDSFSLIASVLSYSGLLDERSIQTFPCR